MITMKYLNAVWNRIWKDIRANYIPLIILMLYMACTQLFFHTVCPFALFTGRPCPGCGLTRATCLLFTGQFTEALQMNPSVCLWLALILYLIVYRYFLGKKPPLLLLLASVVCVITMVIFLIRLVNGDLANIVIPTQGLIEYLGLPLPDIFF